MSAKKKTTKKVKAKPSFRALKLVVHNVETGNDGSEKKPYRYLIAGVLVSDRPIQGLPSEDGNDWVLEGVDEGVMSPVSLIQDAFPLMRLRKAKLNGLSADQFLTRLQEV